MTSKEYIKAKLEYLIRYEPSLSFDIDMYEKILQDLERLEVLEKLVYTNQFENTKNIENEFGRAFTILQNHCVAMEDTLHASRVLIQLISKYEKLKNVVEIFSKYCYLVNTPNTEEYFIESADYIIIPKKEVELLKEVLSDE